MEDIIDVGGQPYVVATSSRIDDRTRTLKYRNTFAVLDRYGDIQSVGQGDQGIYHEDTRHLSRLDLRFADGARPVLLNSTIKEDNSLLTVDLTNPDLHGEGRPAIAQDTVHISRAILLWNGTCHQQLHFQNYGRTTVRLEMIIEFGSDYADMFEVRGARRARRGALQTPRVDGQAVVLSYDGLDGIRRETRLEFQHPGVRVDTEAAHLEIALEPGEESRLEFTVTCGDASDAATRGGYEAVLQELGAEIEEARRQECLIYTSNELFNDWINRSAADLHMLISDTPHGPYPYAGVPWFSTPFGRDGIITALQYLWVNPELARGVLAYLAATQATEVDPQREAEPGKILHETRSGEMARLGEVPFARYYGTIDATPLFVVLAGAYLDRTGDSDFIESIMPNIEAALAWIDNYGDKDGDGFFEYSRQGNRGLVQQGWKDSDDSIFHADGSDAEGPIALSEVQGYVYDAWRRGAALLSMLGDKHKAGVLRQKASDLKERFDRAFWCRDIGTYAIALDGRKRPCRVRSSNAGHVLYSGIATPERAARVAHTLLSERSFSGWGVRTVAEGEARYNPMSYHNGSVWPHDNAITAVGLARYNHFDMAMKIVTGLFDASLFLELHRLPELFCGFARRTKEGPTLYPVACLPQAWASAVVFQLLQVCLGLHLSNNPRPHISFNRPQLPDYLDSVELRNLRVGDASADILIRRHENDAGVIVTRREGDVQVAVFK